MRLINAILTVALLLIPASALAQSPQRPDQSRLFFDINIAGFASPQADSRTFTSLLVIASESASMRATYPKPERAGQFPFVEVAGGYWFTERFGVGVGVSRTAYEDKVQLAATIPHPVFFNAAATGSGFTTEIRQTETAANIFAAILPVRTPRGHFRLYAGPTVFWYSADMVNEIQYTQQASQTNPSNAITLDGFTTAVGTGVGVGFHLGFDVAYFFHRYIGVVGGARFATGVAGLDTEPLSGISQDIRVGGVLITAGVRFRFGGLGR